MNELTSAVAQLILTTTQAAESAGKFAIEQLPDIAQQYVLYVGVLNTIFFFVCLLVLGFCVYGTYKIHKQIVESMIDEFYVLLFFFWLVGGGLLVGFTIISFNKMILAWFAPKILLIQWAAELVK